MLYVFALITWLAIMIRLWVMIADRWHAWRRRRK